MQKYITIPGDKVVTLGCVKFGLTHISKSEKLRKYIFKEITLSLISPDSNAYNFSIFKELVNQILSYFCLFGDVVNLIPKEVVLIYSSVQFYRRFF